MYGARRSVAAGSAAVVLFLLAGVVHAADEVDVERDIVYARPGGVALRLDAYTPRHATGPLPSVIVIHGGSWRSGGKGASTEVQVVVAAAAPCDFTWMPRRLEVLRYWLGKTRGEARGLYRQASPLSYAHADAPPILFLHGRWDVLVNPMMGPRKTVRRLRRASTSQTDRTKEPDALRLALRVEAAELSVRPSAGSPGTAARRAP